ncbi:hypothetical protein [Deinococcus aerophilus]|uniref:Lipoprotein n=1 Tax=Deinococcus aerophilus TaxID=522488 RepID=A0ABQ2GKN6_9DEIO|nr:hypothetical protein [Deinococcus aerophilus]GGL99889.1 hypothetical protein GCM10010841_05610 [Deinococcus aerophilus]
MKKLSLLALPLILAACGETGVNVGQGFGMTAALNGTEVSADVVNVYSKNADGTRGAYVGSEVKAYKSTQGNLNFQVQAASLGLTITSAKIVYTDASGTPFAAPSNVFNISMILKVPEGYVCPSNAASCTYTDKTATPVTFGEPGANLYLLSEQAAIAAADSCVDGSAALAPGQGGCAEVRMNITLSGQDTLGTIRTVTIPQAQVRVYIATVTEEVR